MSLLTAHGGGGGEFFFFFLAFPCTANGVKYDVKYGRDGTEPSLMEVTSTI